MERTVGHAHLIVRERDGSAVVQRFFQSGAARMHLPARRDPAVLEAVMINTAGGITGGDALSSVVELEPGVSAVIAGQACEKVYRALEGDARVDTRIELHPGSDLAWLPQPTIAFDACRLRRHLDVRLHGDARFFGIESLLLGRDAMGERVQRGFLRDAWRVWRNDALVFADEFRVSGAVEDTLAAPTQLGSARALSTMLYAATDAPRRLDEARAILGEVPDIPCGASVVADLLVIRLLAPSGQRLIDACRHFIERFRGQPMPRVWNC